MDLTRLRRQQRAAPAAPGVYFFRAPNGTPLYIGKAKSLRHRLGSHLSHPATRGGVRLLEETATLDYIICESEWQALLLEQELVAAAQPIYNVALRFSRRYPRIAVSWDETFPRVYASTERPQPGRRYFGPYEGEHADALIDLLARLYPFRSCEGTAPGRASGSPCLDFFIHRCARVGCTGRRGRRGHLRGQVAGGCCWCGRGHHHGCSRVHSESGSQSLQGRSSYANDSARLTGERTRADAGGRGSLRHCPVSVASALRRGQQGHTPPVVRVVASRHLLS